MDLVAGVIMSLLLGRIVAAMIWSLGWKSALIAYKEWMKYYGEQYAALTPDQKAEWDRDWIEEFKTGKGDLPEGPGIILKDAIEPEKHVGDEEWN